MHFGGFHFIVGLLLLLSIILVSMVYLYCGYALFVLCQNQIYRLRKTIALNKYIAGSGKSPDEVVSTPRHHYWNRSLLFRMLIISIVFHSAIYLHQRMTWMTSNNQHYEAKEYWIVGQVVYTNRMMLGRVLHPDNFLIRPLVWLQRAVYVKGVKYLPSKDGERYVWRNAWFYYPYSRNLLRPYGVSSKEYEPEMVDLLNGCWDAMKAIMTKKINDSAMNRKALLSYPFLSSYYSQYQGHYTGPYWLSGVRTRNNPIYRARNYQMLEWLDELMQRWRANGYIDEIWKKYPSVASFRQHNIIRLLNNLSLALPLAREFTCDNKIVVRLNEEYRVAMSDDPKLNSFMNLERKNPRQAALTYQSALYSPLGQAGNYFLSHICEKILPEEKYILAKKNNQFYDADWVERIYNKELETLKKRDK